MRYLRPEVRLGVSVGVIGLVPMLVVSSLLGVFAESDTITFDDSAKYEESSCTLPNGVGEGVCRHPSRCQRYLSTIPREDWTICLPAERNQLLVCCEDTHDTPTSLDISAWRRYQNCSVSMLSNHIFGGTEVNEPQEFPYMAALGYPGYEEHPIEFRCGASLVTRQFLLTAAHCNTSQGPVMARLGVTELFTTNPIDPPIDIAIARVFIHPRFRNRPKTSDIALLKLERAFYEDFVQPICLYTEPTDPAPGLNLTIVGWGSTDDSDERSDVLLKAIVNTWDRTVCKERLARNRMWLWNRFELQDSQLCAMRATEDGEPLADSCRGDWGGPLELVHHNHRYLVGVVSAGWGCGTWNLPGIYTRVAHHIEWIDQIITLFSTTE